VDGLVVGRLDVGATVVLWAAAPSAPIDQCVDANGAAVVWGDALKPGAMVRSSAATLREAWQARECLDGFFAAVTVQDGTIALGGDLLGLFPLYVSAVGEVFVAASSPAPFAWHPLMDVAFDVEGLLGLLLTGGPFDGRTLQRGVRRVAAGARAEWSATTGLREVRGYQWPRPPVDESLSFEAQMERFDAAQARAVARHAGVHERVAVLLSGGRDSRMLAGYLAKAGRSETTVTLGDPSDHDAMCAAAVARALKWPHRLHAVPFERFPAFADRALTWERLSGGMSSMHAWATLDALRPAPSGSAVLSGYIFEARQLSPLPPTREGMLQWTHARAMTPQAVTTLLRPEYRDLVPAVMERVRRSFDDLAEGESVAPAEVSWRWLMAVYARFHPGAVPWRMSFAAWPVLPILDQALLELTLSIPPAFLAERRMQDAILRTRFPALARLPLDRNAADVRPLLESRASRFMARTREIFSGSSRSSVERRYFARMYNFDNPGWRAIRGAAEPGREALHEWFEPAALAALVPVAGKAAAHADPIAEGFGPKMLAGLMRWQVLAAAKGDDAGRGDS
jgi:asparagine synthase (glutamine-hydrolysing)